jgi:hypothetical protein
MNDLKCCPFCGGEAEVGLTNQHDKLFIVGCNTPMCYGNINHFAMSFVSKESAINTWNTRTPIANIVEKLEELPYGRSYHDYAEKGIVHKYLERNDVLDIVKQEINKEN